MGRIKQAVKQRIEAFKQQQREKNQLERQIRLKEKAAYNQAYMHSRITTARQRGLAAGKKGKNTLGPLRDFGLGLAKSSDAMIDETLGVLGHGRKRKRKTDDFLGF